MMVEVVRLEKLIMSRKAEEKVVKKSSKFEQTGLWICTLVALILGSLQCTNAGRRFSREDAFVGYSEQPFKSRYFDSGLLVIPDEYLILTTHYGEIKVKLATRDSPRAVEYIKSLVSRGVTKGCSFYRAEPVGPTIDEGRDGFRQGYALVQGGLYSCGQQESNHLPVETLLNITKGSASLITGTSEFFFSLEAHPDWDGSFSVWGEVVGPDSWRALQSIASLPTRQEVHASGTVLRMLVKVVSFEARLEPSRANSKGRLGRSAIHRIS